jgi:chemotaxis protein MotB
MIELIKKTKMKKLIFKHNNTFYILVTSILISSCVPLNRFQDIKKEKDTCKTEKDSINKALVKEQTLTTELSAEIDILKNVVKDLEKDTLTLGNQKRDLEDINFRLNQMNDNLLKNQTNMIQENSREAQKMLSELQSARVDLQKREDNLESLKLSLEKERKNLEKIKAIIDKKDLELKEKEKLLISKNEQLKDLQEIIRLKDSATMAIKNKISTALQEFEGNGLSVNFKNGMIYVSLDESLLFKTGQSDVNPRGIDAISKLAKVLEVNEELDIIVEGHTDNTGAEKFNWELSTKRALAIAYIIMDNAKISKDRIVASGRGQFSPIDTANTIEARSKNRRSEIILKPKLYELYELIESK